MAKLSIEELTERGIMDERDQDYLNHLEIPAIEINDVATEGIIRATLHDKASIYTDAYREIKGWFIGIESKRRYTEQILDDLAEWLQDKDYEHRDMDLDMGSFKTWMKTSETFTWRYYFLLSNSNWSKVEADLKAGNITNIESMTDFDFTERKNVARYLDSLLTIKDLIKTVDLYKTRMNKFYKLIVERKIKIKGAPFQVILLGANDLRRTLKKIVNLAI